MPGDIDYINLGRMIVPLELNYCQCMLELEEFYEVIEHTTELLEKHKGKGMLGIIKIESEYQLIIIFGTEIHLVCLFQGELSELSTLHLALSASFTFTDLHHSYSFIEATRVNPVHRVSSTAEDVICSLSPRKYTLFIYRNLKAAAVPTLCKCEYHYNLKHFHSFRAFT